MSLTVPVLDVLYPFAGPCAFCGGPDKRHRLADSITENVAAGDSIGQVAYSYDVTPEAVEALVADWTPGKCNQPLVNGRCGFRGNHAGARHRVVTPPTPTPRRPVL